MSSRTAKATGDYVLVGGGGDIADNRKSVGYCQEYKTFFDFFNFFFFLVFVYFPH